MVCVKIACITAVVSVRIWNKWPRGEPEYLRWMKFNNPGWLLPIEWSGWWFDCFQEQYLPGHTGSTAEGNFKPERRRAPKIGVRIHLVYTGTVTDFVRNYLWKETVVMGRAREWAESLYGQLTE